MLVINTPFGRGARSDGYEIRTTALRKGVPCITTLAGASAAVSAIEAARRPRVQVHCLQDLHRRHGGRSDGQDADAARRPRAVGGDVATAGSPPCAASAPSRPLELVAPGHRGQGRRPGSSSW